MLTVFLNISNYLILASTWNEYNNFVSLSLMNIFIGLFFLSNIIITLSLFIGTKNNILSKIKFLGLSSNNPLFNVFYAILGTSSVLWTFSFRYSSNYYAILI